MKRIFTSLLLLLSFIAMTPHSAAAQDAQRTIQTKVSDALNQLPAQNQELFARLMQDLLSDIPGSVPLLTQRLKGNHTTLPQVVYALDGMTLYATTAEGTPDQRRALAEAYAQALSSVPATESKAFLIRQLQLLGQAESIAVLAPLFFDSALSAPAIEAVSAINDPLSVSTLSQALAPATTEENQTVVLQLLEAMAYLGHEDFEEPLQQFIAGAKATNAPAATEYTEYAYYALSRCGTTRSLKIMEQAPTAHFLTLLNRLLQNGQSNLVAPQATKLIKAGQPSQVRCNALRLLIQCQKDKAGKIILHALYDKDAAYRQTALESATSFLDAHALQDLCASIKKTLPKLPSQTQALLLSFIGKQGNPQDAAFIAKYLTKGTDEMVRAAAGALAQIDSPVSIAALISLLQDPNPARVELAEQSLHYTQGDIVTPAVAVFENAQPATQAAILRLLGAKKSQAHEALVAQMMASPHAQVRAAALYALPHVAVPAQRPTYYKLLEQAAEKGLTQEMDAYSQAVLASLNGLTPSEQFQTLSQRMQQLPEAQQSLYYPLLAQTHVEQALDLVGAKLSVPQYIDLIARWKETPEKKFTYLCRALHTPAEAATQPNAEETAQLLNAIGTTQLLEALTLSGKYLSHPNAEVAYCAAMNVYTIATGNEAYRNEEVMALVEEAAGVLAQSNDINKIYYATNIEKYLKEAASHTPYQLSEEEAREGFELLFDGTRMDHFMGNTIDYIPQNGTIAVQPTGQGFGDLYTVKEYGDFIFRFEFKLTKGANNGVGIRAPGTGDAAYVGMEIQILDHYDEIYQPDLRDYQYHGSVYGVIPSHNRDALKPLGEWNVEEIYAKGNYIRVTLNGEVITEGDISAGPIDKREHPGLFNKKGHIGFLGHGSPLWLRHIRVKEL